MSAPLFLLFTSADRSTGALVDEGQAQALRAYLASLPAGSVWRDRFYVGAERQTEHGALDAVQRGEKLILLAIGPEGGAELARWVAEHGLDGVRGVGLVGVTAPWAERILLGLPDDIYNDGPDYEGEVWPPMPEYSRLPLGPLTPLRAVAERARDGHAVPLRFVVACAPDDGVCSACDGSGEERIEPPYVLEPEIRDCATCRGARKALSSRRIAEELIGVPVERTRIGNTHPQVFANGGCSAILYPSRAELDAHGLRAVVERLMR